MLVEVNNLAKHFRVRNRDRTLRRLFTPSWDVKRAVDDVSFAIDRGEIVGYLGANGAGKSTTVKCLSGILAPDSGTISVAGFNPSRQRIEMTRRIGVIFGQKSSLWWDLPVRDTYQLLREIYQIPRAEYQETLESLDEVLGLGDFIHIPTRQLSLGQRVRADLAAAFLHRPEVVFLDEPTIGLDALAKSNMRRFITKIRDMSQVTVMLTTHDLGDIEQLCDRLLIIDRGSLLFDGSVPEAIRHFAPQTSLVVELSREVDGTPRPPDTSTAVTWESATRLRIDFAREADVAARLISQVLSTYPVRDLHLEEPHIEDVVRRIYATSPPAGLGAGRV